MRAQITDVDRESNQCVIYFFSASGPCGEMVFSLAEAGYLIACINRLDELKRLLDEALQNSFDLAKVTLNMERIREILLEAEDIYYKHSQRILPNLAVR